ncbi:MAG: FhaA domain-containing protein [Candidatus Baltobacteraceae bacterium]
MSWLARIEEACAVFIEQTFARTFPSDLEPAHIARKLVSTMEARTTHEGDRASAPSRYTVRVNSEDYERLKPHQLYLEEEWTALLQDMARLVSITLTPPVVVRLREDAGIIAGVVEIEAGSEDPVEPTGASLKEVRQPAKEFCLRMLRGLPVDAVYPVRDQVSIGRNKGNDIVIEDPRVSRRHARIEAQRDRAMLIDLDSTNGTLLDGRKVSGRVPLHGGNVITLGNTSLRFEEVPS